MLPMFEHLREVAEDLKEHIDVYRMALKDSRTPPMAKVLLGAAIIYTVIPFDFIPDFIPIIGHLDDAIIIPSLVKIALKMIPEEVLEECRMTLRKNVSRKPQSRLKAGLKKKARRH